MKKIFPDRDVSLRPTMKLHYTITKKEIFLEEIIWIDFRKLKTMNEKPMLKKDFIHFSQQ